MTDRESPRREVLPSDSPASNVQTPSAPTSGIGPIPISGSSLVFAMDC
jgi:hypothetical protein